jgi:hypothetical protein
MRDHGRPVAQRNAPCGATGARVITIGSEPVRFRISRADDESRCRRDTARTATEQQPPLGPTSFGLSVSNWATVAGCSRSLLRPRAPKAGPSGSGDHRTVGYSSRGERRSRATSHEVSDLGHANHQSNRWIDLKHLV